VTAILLLEDGSIFRGRALGASGVATGEVVFNTSLTGYQEIITDPSYCGQIVTMTNPEIGNYGINREDNESRKPFLSGFVMREYSPIVSNYRSELDIDRYFQDHNIIGIERIDTRRLTKLLRIKGSLHGIISSEEQTVKKLKTMLADAPRLVGRDLVREVTCSEPYEWMPQHDSATTLHASALHYTDRPILSEQKYSVVCIDCGIKHNILRGLYNRGCRLTIVPANTPAHEITALNPDGIFLSNGPGDPEPLQYIIETVKTLLTTGIPLFGICLGHQMLGLALGGRSYKLRFGHHGGNQPVMRLTTKTVEITAQNHGFNIDPESIPKELYSATHINLNDKTLEGIACTQHNAFSVQYHPESAPGPHDSRYLFDEFIRRMETRHA